MPQFMLSVHHGDDDALPEGVDLHAVFAAVEAFNQRLVEQGAMVFAGGLQPASSAMVVGRDGDVTTGPYLAGDEYLGGFWIVEAAGEQQALRFAQEAVATGCSRTVEVRPLQTG